MIDLCVQHLLDFDTTSMLHNQLVNYPQEVIPLMELVINETFNELFNHGSERAVYLQICPYGLKTLSNIRLLDPSNIDQLIALRGLVVRVSNIIPEMRIAFFTCSSCGYSVTVENLRGRISEPLQCPRADCAQPGSMNLIHNRCIFSDKQIVKLQETPESIPPGQTPHSVTLCIYDAFIDSMRPGDRYSNVSTFRVEVTGVFRSCPIRVNPIQRRLKSIFRTFIDVVHSAKLENSSSVYNNHVDLGEIEQISRSSDCYERLSSSIGTCTC